jgi:hypothetical protein
MTRRCDPILKPRRLPAVLIAFALPAGDEPFGGFFRWNAIPD